MLCSRVGQGLFVDEGLRPMTLPCHYPYPIFSTAPAHHRIHHVEKFKTGKIPVARPQLSDSMNVAKNRHSGVVDFGSFQIQPPNEIAKLFRKILRLGQQSYLWGRGELSAGFQGRFGRRGFGKYLGMGNHCVKFIQTGPGDGPAGALRCQFFQALPSLWVPHRIRPVGIDQQIGVDRDQKSDRINQISQGFPIYRDSLRLWVAESDQPKSFALLGRPVLQRHFQPLLR